MLQVSQESVVRVELSLVRPHLVFDIFFINSNESLNRWRVDARLERDVPKSWTEAGAHYHLLQELQGTERILSWRKPIAICRCISV